MLNTPPGCVPLPPSAVIAGTVRDVRSLDVARLAPRTRGHLDAVCSAQDLAEDLRALAGEFTTEEDERSGYVAIWVGDEVVGSAVGLRAALVDAVFTVEARS